MAEKTKAQLEQELAEANAKLEVLATENPDLAALKQQLDEANAKLAEAEAKAAETAEDDGVKPAVDTSTADTQAYLNEKVPFYAFKDDNKYKDDIVAGVNGTMYTIQRGVHVKIPRFLAIQLEASERQLNESANLTQGLVDEYNRKSKVIN